MDNVEALHWYAEHHRDGNFVAVEMSEDDAADRTKHCKSVYGVFESAADAIKNTINNNDQTHYKWRVVWTRARTSDVVLQEMQTVRTAVESVATFDLDSMIIKRVGGFSARIDFWATKKE